MIYQFYQEEYAVGAIFTDLEEARRVINDYPTDTNIHWLDEDDGEFYFLENHPKSDYYTAYDDEYDRMIYDEMYDNSETDGERAYREYVERSGNYEN